MGSGQSDTVESVQIALEKASEDVQVNFSIPCSNADCSAILCRLLSSHNEAQQDQKCSDCLQERPETMCR